MRPSWPCNRILIRFRSIANLTDQIVDQRSTTPIVAGELERRWNEKLAEVEDTKQRLSSLNENDGRYLPMRKTEFD